MSETFACNKSASLQHTLLTSLKLFIPAIIFPLFHTCLYLAVSDLCPLYSRLSYGFQVYLFYFNCFYMFCISTRDLTEIDFRKRKYYQLQNDLTLSTQASELKDVSIKKRLFISQDNWLFHINFIPKHCCSAITLV